MKKEKEKDILDKLIDNEFDDNDKKKLKNKLFVYQFIALIIVSILLIISYANIKRSVLFSYLVFNNTFIIPIFLYVSLTIFFFYTIWKNVVSWI